MINFLTWSILIYILTVLAFFTYELKNSNQKTNLKEIISKMYKIEFVPYINTIILIFVLVFFSVFFGTFYIYAFAFEINKFIKYKRIRRKYLQKIGF